MKSKFSLVGWLKSPEGLSFLMGALLLTLVFVGGVPLWDGDYALAPIRVFERVMFALSHAIAGDSGWGQALFKGLGLVGLVIVLVRWMDFLKFEGLARRVLLVLFLTSPVLWSSMMTPADASVFGMAFLGEALLRFSRTPQDRVGAAAFALLWLSTLGELQFGAHGMTYERLSNAVVHLSSFWPFFFLVLVAGAIVFEFRRKKTERLFSSFQGWTGVGVWLMLGLVSLVLMPETAAVFSKRFALLIWVPLLLGLERLLVRVPFEMAIARAVFWIVFVIQVGLNLREVASERASSGRVRSAVNAAYHAIAERNPEGVLYRTVGFQPYGAWVDAPPVLKRMSLLPPDGQGAPVYPWILSWSFEPRSKYEFVGAWNGCEAFHVFDWIWSCDEALRLYLVRELSFIPMVLQQAEAFRTTGDFAAADQAYRSYFADGTLNVGALFDWGLTLSALQNWKDMEQVYRQIVTLVPEYVQAHFNLGFALRNQQKFEEAHRIFSRLGTGGTDDLGTLTHWIETALEIQDRSSAKEALALIESRYPQSAGLPKWKSALND